ncbi:MAG: PQQ-dependent sugar dehydrogenase, partial [Burkholderiales bacterium]|nr:PQQ-dependent sugar dehydrogenase [Phycisphaerae bacterium]
MTVISGFQESLVAGGLSRAVQMDFAPDGRLFVTQQDGKLRVIKNGSLLATPFVTVPSHNTGESGLIGITFDPNFASNKYLYIYYTRPDGAGGYKNRVSRFTANGDVAVAGSEKVLLEGDGLGPSTWHNSGALKFGLDGKLYIASGDNQKNSQVQNKNSLFGKILRINSDGTIPTDNPFYATNTGKYRSVWSYGHRNPFTMDVQPGTGRIFVSEVGQAAYEEINEIKKGANYGWPSAEGPSSNPAYTNPFYAYAHPVPDADSAITGAAFYNPKNSVMFPSDYVGDFFFGDYGQGFIKRIDSNSKAVNNFGSNISELTDIDIAADGSLYYLSRANGGQVFRVRSTTSTGPSISVPPQSKTVAASQPVTFNVTAAGSGTLSYRWQRNSVDIAGATGASYTISNTQLSDNGAQFRAIVSNAGGSVTSSAATLTVLNNKAPVAAITSPSADFLWTGGGEIAFSGTGMDTEDGTLPASAFTWEIDFHHAEHHHPFIAPYSGVKSDSVTIPTVGETAPDVFYRIRLTVKDSAGLTHTVERDIYPQKINLTLATEPAGLSVTIDGQ